MYRLERAAALDALGISRNGSSWERLPSQPLTGKLCALSRGPAAAPWTQALTYVVTIDDAPV